MSSEPRSEDSTESEAASGQSVAEEEGSPRAGFFYALTAYAMWGFLPLFFRAAEHIPASELVIHRVLWSLPTAAIVLGVLGRLHEIPPLLKNWKIVRMMVVTALLISINWGIYVWAISVNLASETALGYYINPLLTVLIGYLLLGERLGKWQALAVALAFTGVLIRTVMGGVFPWISLSLAFSFAIYGYLRKTVAVGPTQGFMIEVIILFPFALVYAVWLAAQGGGHVELANGNIFWLMACGPVTAFPLIFYAYGAKRLRLATIGLMQYIAPSMIFIIAFFVFGEELDFWQGVTFVLIWSALAIYSWSTFRSSAPKR